MSLSWCRRRKELRGSGDHYRSPGRLADYWHQFEKTGRQDGEDPSIFAIELETLGDMGPNALIRLIRDQFIAGHLNCAMRRNLDSVPPETPIRGYC